MGDIKWQPKVNGNVGRANNTKPDPDEPWRYVCPHCEGQVKHSSIGKWECSTCGEITETDNLVDLKGDGHSL